MTNKYQKALNFLDWHCRVEHQKQQDLLQELVDKETPMKPYYLEEYPSADCPKCFQNLGDNNHLQILPAYYGGGEVAYTIIYKESEYE